MFAVKVKIYGVLYNQASSIAFDETSSPTMFAVKVKIYGELYNQASSIAFDETSSDWSALKSS